LGVVHPETTAGTVLDDKIRMAVKDFLNPAQISAIVSQQAVARGIGLEIRSRSRVDIVVDFQISDAKLLNKALNDLVGMRADFRISKIELIAPVVYDSRSIAQEEPTVRQFFPQRATDPDHLDLEPKSGNHPFCTDPLKNLRETRWKSRHRSVPQTDRFPPCFANFRVPARSDNKIFRSRLSRALYEREQRFRGGIAPKAIHVVVEDHREALHVRMRSP